jgi:hypothetical protein
MTARSKHVDVRLEIDTSDDRVIEAITEMLLSLAERKEQNDG